MISTLLLIVATAVFIYAAYQLITIYFAYKVGVDEYKELNGYVDDQIIEPTDTTAETVTDEEMEEILERVLDDMEEKELTGEDEDEELQMIAKQVFPEMENPVDFESLCAMNEDIIGWLQMEAIDISYPLVQGKNNDYYLHRTFQRTDNFAGSIFLDCVNKRNFSDANSIVYGHNMNNGSMFGILRKYRDKETFQKSPYFWIYGPRFIYKYKIFACAEVSKTGDAYEVSFGTKEDYQEFLYKMKEEALYDTGVDVSTKDKLVTLSTCTGNDATRFIVQGKRVAVYRSVPKAGGYETEQSENQEGY